MHNTHFLTQDGKWIAVSDDELYHWKYIKREKVNGKYRYYYKDTDVDDAKKVYDTAKTQSDSDTKAANAITNRVNTRIANLNEAFKKKYPNIVDQDKNWTEFFDQSKPLIEAKNKAQGRAAESKKVADEAELNYKAAKRKYKESAGHKVADFLNKSSDAIDKAKTWVSGLFSKKKNK